MSARTFVALIVGVLAAGVLTGVLVSIAADAGRAPLAGLLAGLSLAAGWTLAALRPELRHDPRPALDLEAARGETRDARAELIAFQSTVAHDLRSPIGAVLNFAMVLEYDHGDSLDDDGRAILKRIRRSAESALSRLEALYRLAGVTRAPLRETSIEIEPLLRRAFAEARPGEVELRIDGHPPRLIADADLLRTAFTELFDNALKFSSREEGARVVAGGKREPDGSAVYWVSDEGVGFDMRFAGKIFDVYERLHDRDEFPGDGVGLAIVRKIAERHGGRAWIEAEPKRGARAFLALPSARVG